MKIIYDNIADTAWIECIAGGSVSTLPASNLGLMEPEKLWRMPDGVTSATLAVSFASRTASAPTSIKPVNSVVLYGGNFSSASTWRVQIWEDETQAVQVYDSGTVALVPPIALGDLAWGTDPLGKSMYLGWPHTVGKLWFPTVYGGYMRIEIADSAPPDGYMQARRLFVGDAFEPVHMPARGVQSGVVDRSKQQRTDGGNLYTEPGAQYRRLSVAGQWISAWERLQVSALKRQKGLREDVFITIFPGLGNSYERDHEMQAKLVSLDLMTLATFDYANQQLVFEEV